MNTEMMNNTDSPMDEQTTTDDMVTLSTTNSMNINASDERDRKQFTLEIHRFMAEVGKPLSKIPIMGYKELDLYQLFKEVTAHGGFNEVVKNVGTWSKIWKRLGNFDPSITDSSFRLKKNYERYLLEYEFKCFPEHRLQAMEFQEKSSLKRSSSTNNFTNISSPSSGVSVSSQVARPHSPSSVSTSTAISSSSSPSSSTLTSNMIQISHTGTTNSTNFISHNTSDSTTQTSPSFSRKSTLTSSTSVPNLSSLANGGSPKVLKKKRASRQPPSRSNSFNSNAPSGSPYNSPSRSNSSNNLSVLSGNISFPLYLGDLIVESLGTITPRFPYVVNGQVYPIGFQSSRMYTSRINPEKQVKYISQIVESGDGPEFIVTASDDPEHPIVSRESPSECWRTILQYFMEIDESSEVSSEELSVSGRLRFGLTHPEVANLIKDLPNYNKAVESTGGSGSMSPTTKRKYQSDDDETLSGQKAPKFKTYMTRSSSTTSLSRGDDESIGDLETAVATLQNLKYCLVY